MLEDIKSKNINVIVALKLDRLTRSVYDIEKIIRIIPIKDNDKFKSNKLELGIITINLSSVRSTNGKLLYKNIYSMIFT